MSRAFANTACTIEVYPFEGGPYVLAGGQIKRVIVSKNLRDGAGSMQLDLAPGGPNGIEGSPTWSQVITPMSHVLVGMSRGDRAAVVMDGVAVAPVEQQSWQTGSPDQGASAMRIQTISGADFGWFFKSFNFFALTFYGMMIGTPVNEGLYYLPQGLVSLLSKGLIGAAQPVQAGRLWFQNVMAGPNGILGHTFVPYKNNSRKTFTEVVAAQWEYYPEAYIPIADYFMVSEENWLGKFQGIFPFPWYDFFVTTAPSGAYLAASGVTLSGIIDPGTQFGMASMPQAPPGGPVLVARVNPTPKFKTTVQASAGTVAPGDIDATRWNALPLYDFTQEPYGFYNSSVSFSAEDARNFYQLNPTAYKTLFGVNNANGIPFPFSFIAASDAASVQRYGFRPEIGSTRWLYDANGAAASAQEDVQQTILSLTAAMISWFHPQPLMARASVAIPLTPDILVGTRFRYAPFKDGVPWDFYIEAFRHTFVFGGESATTLTLSRGLPTAVYQAVQSGGLLQAIHTGNAMRQNGIYTVGLPTGTGPALTFVITTEQAMQLNQLLTNVPVTPQWSGTGSPPTP
jgi:hypothetical protein